MRWGGAAAILAALLVLSGEAGAQYLTFDAARRGAAISEAHPSLRLEAMGGLFLVVPDENNELNLSDFGDNVAGIAADRSGWSVESWFGRNNRFVDENATFYGTPVRQRDRLDLERGGLDVVYRHETSRALGMTAYWNGYDTRLTYGPNSRVSGPDYRFFFNQAVGPVTAGIGVNTASDKENLVASDVFAIHHVSQTRRLSLAAGVDLGALTSTLRGMYAGLQVDADRVRITGASADPAGFHGDEFNWRRPATGTRLTLVRPEGPGRLAFGVNFGRLRREGTEEATISWADRFPANPARVNYTIRVPSFTEKETSWDTEGRVSWRLSPRLRFGGSGIYQKFDSAVHEAPNSNFVGSRRQEDSRLTSWQVAGGLGATLRGGRLRAGLEGAADGGRLVSDRPRESSTVKTRTYEARAGAEYLIVEDLAVRAGYQRRSTDSAVGQPGSLGLSRGLTIGFGYVPRGGLVAIDTYLRVWKETPDVPADLDRRSQVRDLGISARMLF
jgi:hypothetical protein